MSRGDFDEAWERIAGGLGAMIVVTDGIVDIAKREYSKNKTFLDTLQLEMRADQPTLAAYVQEQVNILDENSFNRELYLGAAAVAYDLIKRQAVDNQMAKGKMPSPMYQAPFVMVSPQALKRVKKLRRDIDDFKREVREWLVQDGNMDLVRQVKNIVGVSGGVLGFNVEEMVLLVYALLRYEKERQQ